MFLKSTAVHAPVALSDISVAPLSPLSQNSKGHTLRRNRFAGQSGFHYLWTADDLLINRKGQELGRVSGPVRWDSANSTGKFMQLIGSLTTMRNRGIL